MTPGGDDAARDLAAQFAERTGEPPLPLADDGSLSALDFSLGSLAALDRYLARVHAALAAGGAWDARHVGLAMRAGSYLGEVVRRRAGTAFAWFDDREALEAFPDEFEADADGGLPLEQALILRSATAFWFPVAEVVRAMQEGPIASLASFAEVAVHPGHHDILTNVPGRTHVILTPTSSPES